MVGIQESREMGDAERREFARMRKQLSLLVADNAISARWDLSDNSPQSISNGTITAIAWDTEYVDTVGGHAAGAAKYTAQIAGVYMCAFSVRMVGNAAGVRAAWLETSGSGVRYGYSEAPGSTGLLAMSGCSPIYLAVGDTVEVRVFQNTGGALNYADAGNIYNHFSGVLVA